MHTPILSPRQERRNKSQIKKNIPLKKSQIMTNLISFDDIDTLVLVVVVVVCSISSSSSSGSSSTSS